MFKHTVLNLLKEFSRKELIQLGLFLNSPYHNKSRKVKLLFNEIKKYYPDFNSEELTKERLAFKVNPDLKFRESTFRNLMSDLLKYIEEFLIYEEMKINYPDNLFLLLKSYTNRNQETLFEINIKKISDQLYSSGIDSVYYYNKSLLDANILNFNIINRSGKGLKTIVRNADVRNSYLVNIFIFFVTELINTYLKITITGSKFNINKIPDINDSLIKGIDLKNISNLLKKKDHDSFILEIYSDLFNAFQNLNSEKDFKKYKTSFLKYQNYLSRDEISYHYSMLISYCILSNSLSENSYDSELLKIYESFLNGKYFYDRKTKNIDEDLYRNILLLALRLKKFHRVYRFIKDYSKYLHPEKKENMLKLSYAEFYYFSGSFKNSMKILSKSLNYLNKIKEESFIMKYDIKSLYLMLHYDLNNYETVILHLNNYRKFLIRNELITNERKERINIFLNALEKLVYYKEGDPKVNTSDLNQYICNLKNINYRNWYLLKLRELNVLK